MVALASDWRLAEERAQRFLSPARVVERYRQIAGSLDDHWNGQLTYRQMLEAVVAFDGSLERDESQRPNRRQRFSAE
jgi:hypothetical protein